MKTIHQLANILKIELVVLVLVVGFTFISYSETHYSMSGKVTSVSNDVIEIEDTTQNVWEYEVDKDTKDLSIDDSVDLTFENNHTDGTRQDDRIEKISK